MNSINIRTNKGKILGTVMLIDESEWEVTDVTDDGCAGYLEGDSIFFSSGELAGRVRGDSIISNENTILAICRDDSVYSPTGELIAKTEANVRVTEAFCAGVLLLILNKWFLPNGMPNPEVVDF